MTAALMISSLCVMGTRPFSEGFAAFWSAMMLCVLSIGGTMIMRKFHNSMAVGFFMGSVVAMSQLFFSLFLVYIGYGKDQVDEGFSAKEESLMAFFSLAQSILLGSFAAILAAHRSEILDKPGTAVMDMMDELHGLPPTSSTGAYDPPVSTGHA
jgi:di/tricarboxylate transporter